MKAPLITTTDLGESSVAETQTVCAVCVKQYSKYTCPRCNVRYCNLSCYKAHGSACTESFYRQNVDRELEGRTVEDEHRRKMLEILKRSYDETLHGGEDHAGDSDDDEHEPDSREPDKDDVDADEGLSAATLERLSLYTEGDEIPLDVLTPAERRHFLRAAASGQLTGLVGGTWAPWWECAELRHVALRADGTPVVQEISHVDPSSGSGPSPDALQESPPWPPPPTTPLPPFSKLLPTPPSPQLPAHLLDVLYCYCLTLRLYNGDWAADAQEAGGTVQALSAVLTAPGRAGPGLPASGTASLQGCLARAVSPEGGPLYEWGKGASSQAMAVGVLRDVSCVLAGGRPATVCALCDLHRLFRAAAAQASAPSSPQPRPPRSSSPNPSGAAPAPKVEALPRPDARPSPKVPSNPGEIGPPSPARQRAGGGPAEGERVEEGRGAAVEGSAAEGGKKGLKKGKEGRKGGGKNRQRPFEHLERKVYFFLVWSNERPPSFFEELSAAVGEELQGEMLRLQDLAEPASAGLGMHPPAIQELHIQHASP